MVNNRSPSPVSARPNPNPRSQEREGVGARKSFSGYPLVKSCLTSQPRSFVGNTPANSPAEFTRRTSFGKECGVSFQDNEQKENERDPNIKPPPRVKSPCLGTKHFMSPTISAASKVTPSPRKKVLGDRNESIRTSASLSDGKFHFFSTSSLDFGDGNEAKSDNLPPCLKTMSFEKVASQVSDMGADRAAVDSSQGEEKIGECEADLVVLSPDVMVNDEKSSESLPLSEMPKMVVKDNVGLDVKESAHSLSCSIAPLDADPSVQPYDPMNNYLSPRPQFLRYRPNARIESYIDQGINLDEDFSSSSVSETQNTKGVHSEDTVEEQEDAASSVGTTLAEKALSSGSSNVIQQLDEAADAESTPKPRWFTKWRVAALLLLLVLGFVSMSMTSPGFGNAIYQDNIISRVYSDPYVVPELAKENFHGLVQNSKMWSARSVDYLSHIIHNPRKADSVSPLTFSNLTGWLEQGNGDYMFKELELGPYFESKEEAESLSGVHLYDEDSAEKQSYPEPEEDETSTEMQSYQENETLAPETELMQLHHPEQETGEVSTALQVVEQATQEPETVEENFVFQDQDPAVHVVEQTSSIDKPANLEAEHSQGEHMITSEAEWSVPQSESPEIKPQLVAPNEPLAEADAVSSDDDQPEERLITKAVSESFVLDDTEGTSLPAVASDRRLAPITVAVSLVFASLLTAAVFMCVRRMKDTTPAEHFRATEKTKYQHTDSNMVPVEDTLQEMPSSWTGPIEVDMIGESCPSEMSSYNNTSAHNKKGTRDGDEAQSLQKNGKRSYKREVLATSSDYTTSSSYGSFTTYSIIHPKHRDDDVVTPVRRSSRIRSKVTSP